MKKSNSCIVRDLKKLSYMIDVVPKAEMRAYTSFRIGGKCIALVNISSVEEVIKVTRYLTQEHIPYFVLGRGTNVLAPENYDGVIIRFAEKFAKIKTVYETDKNAYVQIESGANVNDLVKYCKEHKLRGVVDAVGLPGSVAGAVVMNACCYDYSTQNLVTGVLALVDGKITQFGNKECLFDNKDSVFKHNGAIILRVEMKLTKDEGYDYDARMMYIASLRSRQPKGHSAGCVFKNNNNVSSGKILDEACVKGMRVGGAVVSNLHANFIINDMGATSSDVIELMHKMKEKVDVDLQPEIVLMPPLQFDNI